MSNIESGVRQALDGLPVDYVPSFALINGGNGLPDDEPRIVVVTRLLPGVDRPRLIEGGEL